jgi:RecA-family ATPase
MSEAYFEKVRESAVSEILTTLKGARNEALNKAAYALGRHAHLGPANIDAAVSDLHSAAKQIGLNEIEIKATIGSGFKRGGENPKVLEDSDAVPYSASEFDRLIGRLAGKEMLVRDEETRQDKIKKAQEQWERAVPISRETTDAVRPALLYLNSRGLRASTAVDTARFSPNVYDGPAIIFPAVNEEGTLQGVQAVLLTPEGKKREHNGISKYSRGVIAGNVMRIGDTQGEKPICITEGPEDALSVRQSVRDAATVVCTFGKAGMASYNVPRASDVTICADPDLDVDKCAEVLAGDGSTAVHVVRFDTLGVENVKDANDYLREAGEEALKLALAQAKPVEQAKLEAAATERNWPTLFEPIDAAKIPKRRWVYGHHYIRSYVSVVASAGGLGKSSMQMVEGVSVATGKPLLGEPVHETCKVWIVNLEDPMEEMQRRMAAVMQHYDIKADDIRGRLFLDAGRELKMIFAKQSRDGLEVVEEIVEYMIKEINANDIGLVFIDPWVAALGQINENDNAAMNAAVGAVRAIADATDAAIVLTHHIRKQNGEDATIDSVRGAGSLIGAARAARVLNRVSMEEAMKLGVSESEARGIMRVDDGKNNLSLPAEKATYRRMLGVQLPNEEYVGVAVEFKLPDLFDGVKAKHALEVQRIVGAAEDSGEPMRKNVQAKSWVGVAVADVLKLDMEKKHEKAKVKAIVNKWLETGVLKESEWKSGRHGREVPVIVVGEWIKREEAGL